MKFFRILKNQFKDTPPSAYLWNGFLFVALIIIALIDIRLVGNIIAVMSMFSIAFFLEEAESDKFIHLWLLLTPTFWFFVILISAGVGLYHLYEATIGKINRKLNKKISEQ